MMEKTKQLLGLIEVEGLRTSDLRKLVEKGVDVEEIWRAKRDRFIEWGIGASIWGKLRAYKHEVGLDTKIAQYRDKGVELVPFWSEDYPGNLRTIESFPLLLFVKGDAKVLGKEMVAVVGSRKCSRQAKLKAAAVVGALLKRGKVVVSGMALGVDGLAHKACLGQNGKTVGVLAHGLDRVHPRSHAGLAEEMVKSGGALVSERPFGAEIKAKYFLERNRIIVGMSEELVVVEAGVRSGSMASANRAASMGRSVWAVGGSEGTDLLIEEGAGELGLD